MSEERLTKTSYNPCDECNYAFHRHNQESGMCKLCEFKSYINLEEQGLLLKLPCPIGTKVYYIRQCWAPSCKECLGFTMVDNCYTQRKARIFEQEFDYRHLKAFGESVFLTQTEAEEKLRELEGEEKCQ